MKAYFSPALLPLYSQGWQQGLAHTGWSINISERIHYWIPKCVWRNKCSYSLSRSYISSEWSLLRIYLLSHQTNCKLLWGQKFWPSDSGAPRTAALNLDCTRLKNPNGQAAPPHQSNRILGWGGQIHASEFIKSSPSDSNRQPSFRPWPRALWMHCPQMDWGRGLLSILTAKFSASRGSITP